DELPSFFDALKPHMRRNQRGPGMSVGTDYLAKKWGLAEEDIKGALVECGMQIPADENAKPSYVEYDGDLYWVNINRRGEVWINTREKPRPVFRVVQAAKVAPDTVEEPKVDQNKRPDGNGERAQRKPDAVDTTRKSEELPSKPEAAVFQPSGAKKKEPAPPATPAPLPTGPALLEKIRPLMRRNRRGPGGSGSASFLARALKCSEADLAAGFEALGLPVPATPADQPVEREISGDIWWVNKDSRGGLWINGREKQDEAASAPASSASAEVSPAQSEGSEPTPVREATAATATTGVPADHLPPPELPLEMAPSDAAAAPAPHSPAVLPAIRLLLKETKTGGFAGKVDRVAADLGKPEDELIAALIAAGLKIPEKAREKPVFVEHANEIFWLNKNAKGELWVNAKASKFADKSDAPNESPSGEDSKRPVRRVPPRAKKTAELPEQSG
ncbi:MAG TPA: hypothetical protein VL069_14050, partial [Opitutus sp.]|nr:hypothetical protein [Opitutus sp.]